MDKVEDGRFVSFIVGEVSVFDSSNWDFFGLDFLCFNFSGIFLLTLFFTDGVTRCAVSVNGVTTGTIVIGDSGFGF